MSCKSQHSYFAATALWCGIVMGLFTPLVRASESVPPSWLSFERLFVKKPHKISIDQFCDDVTRIYKNNRWGEMPIKCGEIDWKVIGWSHQRRPLVAFEAGSGDAKKMSLVQCGIHGDELPGLAMCINLIDEIQREVRKIAPQTRIVVQPVLNPDGMFAAKASRANARGVDINRNFPTKDWKSDALESWKKRDREDKRKFPGHEPNSEPETQAIVEYIEKFKPQKIISVHTPLGFLDLDSHGKDEQMRRARYLAINMSKNSGNYKFIRFGFYPGSLGNFAGRERQIPVYTLELPPGESRPTIDNYWKKFRLALWRAIDFDLDTGMFFED